MEIKIIGGTKIGNRTSDLSVKCESLKAEPPLFLQAVDAGKLS
jgi:hypothetical protein